MSTPNTTSEYMLFFQGPDWDKDLDDDELREVMTRVTSWFEGLQAQGKIKSGQPLGREGRTLSGVKGRPVSDGPFVESKEAIGGYLSIEAHDLDEAVAIARKCPTLEYGIRIQVRPVLLECPCFERAKERLAHAMA